jgi:hypothetical protein
MSSNNIFSDGNSLCKKVLKLWKDEKLLRSRNGHDQLPPDFYSTICGVMFDALRVNDTEVVSEKGKFINNKFARERKMEKELKQLGVKTDNCTIFCNSEYVDFNEHSLQNFSNQAKRTIDEHISKIHIWNKELPDIKYKGLFIFDESGVYFEGECIPAEKPDENSQWIFAFKDNPPHIYFPWLDKNIMQSIFDSEIDFVVWFCPYKYSSLIKQTGILYPTVAILDVRYGKPLVEYIYDEYTLG